MPAGMHGLLPAARFRLLDGGRHPADGGVSGIDPRSLRAAVRLPHQQAAAAANAALRHVPFSAGRWLLHPSRQAYPVPHFSVLARVGGEPPGMEQDCSLLSGNGPRAVDSNRSSGRASPRDAAGLPGALLNRSSNHILDWKRTTAVAMVFAALAGTPPVTSCR